MAMQAQKIAQMIAGLVLLLICALTANFVQAAQDNHQVNSSAPSAIKEVFNEKPALVDSVFGLRLALLPLADVSQVGNGINLDMTHDLAVALQDRGIDLVPEGEILQFMADNRIRFAGYLDSLLARKLGKEFECGLILLGTVTELDTEREPALGLTLTAMDANSGTPVWSATRAASTREQIRLLGRGDPQAIEDLKQPLLQELLDEFQLNLPKQLPERQKPYQIVSARVTPAYVKGGEVVDFRLEIRFVENPPKQILLDTKIGYIPLYLGKVDNLYLGHWVAPAEEGNYQLTLTFDWGRGELSQRLTDVASYQVINEPPRLKVSLMKGMKIGDVTAFRGSLIILPELLGKTPINHWALTIRGETGTIFLKEERDGSLPSKLVWQGTDGKMRRLKDGLYEMAFEVWDAAGNYSGTTHKVALRKSTVPVQVASVVRDNKTYLQINQQETGVVPVAGWSVKVASLDGQTLLNTQGGFLPAMVELPYLGADTTVLCDIEVEDSLGNFLSLTETKVKVEHQDTQVAQKIEETTEAWTEDF